MNIRNKTSSATTQIACDVDVGAHNLCPLNSPMHYLVIFLFININVYL